jgi:hypothetical protein
VWTLDHDKRVIPLLCTIKIFTSENMERDRLGSLDLCCVRECSPGNERKVGCWESLLLGGVGLYWGDAATSQIANAYYWVCLEDILKRSNYTPQ